MLIFTPQAFLNLLDHAVFCKMKVSFYIRQKVFLAIDRVNLLIFDECHHATGDDPYAMVMRRYYKLCSHSPRILGLTASISAQKIDPQQLQKVARELENIYR